MNWIKAIIRTNVTDHDTDHKGRPRTIRKGTVGVVRGYLSGHYDISWNGGGWTRWTRAELARDADVLMWGTRRRTKDGAR
jgi:hypothetical protein